MSIRYLAEIGRFCYSFPGTIGLETNSFPFSEKAQFLSPGTRINRKQGGPLGSSEERLLSPKNRLLNQ